MPIVEKPGFVNEQGQWWRLFPDGRRTRAFLAVCRYCHQRFPAFLTPEFCSRTCSARARGRTPDIERSCPRCGEAFATRDPRQVHCSHSCAAQAAQERKPVSHDRGIAKHRIKNADNPRFSRDESGQWWYRPIGSKQHGRSRAYLLRCAECDSYYIADAQHVKQQKHCSKSCGIRAFRRANPDRWKGANSARWKGGKLYRRGYVLIHAPGHPSLAGTQRRYVLEHRLVMEESLGRPLLATEHVHHKNGVRDDNRIENLELWANGHPPGQRVTEQKHCPTCTCGAKH